MSERAGSSELDGTKPPLRHERTLADFTSLPHENVFARAACKIVAPTSSKGPAIANSSMRMWPSHGHTCRPNPSPFP